MLKVEAFSNKILQGNCLSVLRTLPDKCIDTVITSPPYWSLRAYQTTPEVWGGDSGCKHVWGEESKSKYSAAHQGDCKNPYFSDMSFTEKNRGSFCINCGAWRGELGMEPTFELYIDHLTEIFNEVKRILKDEGTVWVNIGDTYASSGGASRHFGYNDPKYTNGRDGSFVESSAYKQKVKPKSLCGIPERLALAMTDRLGYIRRNTIIWYKSNVLPASVRDRFTVDFEYVYFFSKNPIYYFEQQFEPLQIESIRRERRGNYDNKYSKDTYLPNVVHSHTMSQIREYVGYAGIEDEIDNRLGRNKRCVWNINTKSFKEAHFATFPEELVQTPVLACVPEHICNKCGKAREKVYKRGRFIHTGGSRVKDTPSVSQEAKEKGTGYREPIDAGYTDCGCGEGFRPGIVLDPFMGSGTTALVALKLNRNFVGIDLNPEYIKITEDRIRSEREKQCLF